MDDRRPRWAQDTEAMTVEERRQVAQRWLQRAGRPVTKPAVEQVSRSVFAFKPGSWYEQAAVDLVRSGTPVTEAAVMAGVREIADAFKVETWSHALPVLIQIGLIRSERGVGPLWGELRAGQGITNEQVRYLLLRLRARGLVSFTEAERSLDLTDAGRQLVASGDDTIDLRDLPLLTAQERPDRRASA